MSGWWCDGGGVGVVLVLLRVGGWVMWWEWVGGGVFGGGLVWGEGWLGVGVGGGGVVGWW